MTDVTLVASIPIQPWKILIIMKTLLVIPMALLLALSVVPAWAKSDNGNGKGQVRVPQVLSWVLAFLCS